jgi:hypothetical protein
METADWTALFIGIAGAVAGLANTGTSLDRIRVHRISRSIPGDCAP